LPMLRWVRCRSIHLPINSSPTSAVGSFEELEWVSVGLVACLYNAWARWRDANVQLCSWFIAIALGSYFLQKSGAGVDIHAQFDLVIAVAMGLGLAFTQVSLCLSRALFGRTKLRRFYCLPYACVCWRQNNSNRYGWCLTAVLRTKSRCGSRQ
jgi:hypothetical protein